MEFIKKEHFLPIIFAIAISLFLFFISFSYSKDVINKSFHQQIQEKYTFIEKEVDYFYKQRESLLFMLTNHKSVEEFFLANTKESKKSIQELFYNQIIASSYINQIRVIDSDGMERVRVDRGDSGVFIIEDEKLQNKANRYYFQEFMKLKKGSLGISKLDLNVEYGVIQRPFLPTVRLAMPLFSEDKKLGILVVNYNMNEWLKLIFTSQFLDSYLVDKDGFFIFHPKPTLSWSRYMYNPVDFYGYFGFEVKKSFEELIKDRNQDLVIKRFFLWDGSEYYAIFKPKDEIGLDVFVKQSKIVGAIITIAVLVLLVPFVFLVFNYLKRLNTLNLRLTENESRINSILNNTFDAIVMIDKNGVIKTVNNSVIDMFLYTKEELIGKNVNILIPEPHHSKHDDYIKSYDKNIISKVLDAQRELYAIKKDGTLINVSLVITQVYVNNELHFIGTIRDVSKERKNKKLFERVFNTSPLGIALVLEDGSLWRVNSKFSSIVGYSNEELMNLTFQDITYKEDLQKDLNYLQQLINKEIDGYTLEKRYIHKDGSLVWINLTVTVSYMDEKKSKIDYFIAVIEDITDKKLIFEELQLAQDRLLQAEKVALIGHWDWNIVDDSLYWSEMMMEIFGEMEESFKANYDSFINIVHKDDREIINRAVEDALKNRRVFDIGYRIVVDEKIKYIHAKGSVTFKEGEAVRFFGTCQDITKIKDLQEKEKSQERLLMQQSKLASMGEMVSAIAHQWRQPLNSIGLTTQDLVSAQKYGELDEKYLLESKKDIMDQLQYMSNTIDEFRNFFRKNSSILSFNILKSVEEVISLYWAQLKVHGIILEIIVVLDGKEYGVSELDSSQIDSFVIESQVSELKQVIINCIANAKDAIVELKNADSLEKKITIYLSRSSESLEIKVSDFAGGIEEQSSDRIFEPYFTTKSMGTGLGLYICKMIVERSLNGKIFYSSESQMVDLKEYRGSSFIIEIPLKS